MLKMDILLSDRLHRSCHNISSGAKLSTSLWTNILYIVLLTLALTVVPSSSLELCGGVRGRFVCDDQDPSVFHICMGNNQYTMACPGMLHFNLRTQNCDWPKSVNCVEEARQHGRPAPTEQTPRPVRRYPTVSLPTHPPLVNTPEAVTKASSWRASVAPTVKQEETSVGHRYRVKVLPGNDKPLETLLPDDKEVVAEIESLSEELKHINNFIKESESEGVGYLVEPYKSKYSSEKLPFMKRHRLTKWRADADSGFSPFRALTTPASRAYRTTAVQNPYRLTSSRSPYRSGTSLSPYRNPYVSYSPIYRYHKKAAATPVSIEKIRDTDNDIIVDESMRTLPNSPAASSNNAGRERMRSLPNRPASATEDTDRSSKSSKWYESPTVKNSVAASYNKNSPFLPSSSNSVEEKPKTYSSHRSTSWQDKSKYTPDSFSKLLASDRDIVDKVFNKYDDDKSKSASWKDDQQDDLSTSRATEKPHTGGSIFTPPPHLANKSNSKYRRYRPSKYRSQEAEKDNKASTFQYASPSNEPKKDKEEEVARVTRPSNYWTKKNDYEKKTKSPSTSKTSETQPWWSTTRVTSRSTPAPTTQKQEKESITSAASKDENPPRKSLYKRPQTYVKFSRRPLKQQEATLSTTATTSKWWSSAKTDQPTTEAPTAPRRRIRMKYKPRHFTARPNYFTRTPSDNFALVPADERSTSYMGTLKNEKQAEPINAPASGRRRSFALHSSYVKAHNAAVSGNLNFELHRDDKISAAAAADRTYEVKKTYESGKSKMDAANRGDRFSLHNDDTDKEISAFKSPVEKYSRKPGKCSSDWCKLPDCRCIGSDIPGGYDAKDIPQMIMLTFDDSINHQNMKYYKDIFNGSAKNPNGCPVKSTFFVSGDNSNYNMVKRMYKEGHEIASHTLSHRNPTTWWATAGYQNWEHEVVGMRDRMQEKSGVPVKEIVGMRAPFLQVGGDAQFAMLKENKFRYDSSMVTGNLYRNNQPPIWPFTLDTPPDSTTCNLSPCPTRSYPGLWEVPLVRWYGSNQLACAMPDACTTDLGAKGSRKFIEENFLRHYNSNRAPLGIFIHASWFDRKAGNLDGLIQFLTSLNDKEDVWVVTVSQALDWVQRPVRLSAIQTMDSWGC